ncbi:MAG TPA: AAA family ATPase [Ferruginibacter sp.]|nr:AAA family ATPase [Ferruginibacter sp.]
MGIKNLFRLLKKHRVPLLIIPLIAVVTTFFLVRNKSNVYRSKIQIATGIVDQSQRVLNQSDDDQDSKVVEQFTNLIETIKLNEVVDQVSFKLLLHDLEGSPFNSTTAKYVEALNPETKLDVEEVLNNKLDSFATLDLNVPREKMIDSLLIKMGYDYETLLKNINVYRVENSDFIDLEVDAESPQLSAFIANTLIDKFIGYNTGYVNSGHSRSNVFFEKLMGDKKDTMDQKIAELEAFKVKNGILDIGDESKDVYQQINDLETHEQQAQKDVIAYAGALKGINAKFDPKDREYVEVTSSKINAKILTARDRLKTLNDAYIQSDFDPAYKKSVDSMQDVLTSQINESSDKSMSDPSASKDDLVQEKLEMENQLELAKYSAVSLRSQLDSLKSRMSGLLPAQAAVKSYERDIDIATKEYLDAEDKFNQSNVSAIVPVQLRQLQKAMPRRVQSSQKIILVILSGITSFIFYLAVLLIVFYMDNSIHSEEDLHRLTGMKVLGSLNLLPLPQKKLSPVKSKSEILAYRDLVRSIRFEIDRGLDGGKVLAITSLNPGEGKTLLSFSLAYAYSLANKKVLLIDGNFTSPGISETVEPKDFIEDFFISDHWGELQNYSELIFKTVPKEMDLLEIGNTTTMVKTIQRIGQSEIEPEKKYSISIMGNRGKDVSLLEICDEKTIQKRMEELKKKFDIIIIEAGSFDTLNKPKEWMVIADKSLVVFESNKALDDKTLPAIEYLRNLNGKMLGWVLNKVDSEIV